MKIIILVPDGVGVRNYLFSSFTSNLLKEGNEVLVYHKLSESAINEIKISKPEIKNFKVIPEFIENPKARLLRETLAYARLLRNKKTLKNKTILMFWNPSKKGFKKRSLYFIAETLGYIFSKSYSLIERGDTLYENEILKSKITKSINKTLVEFGPNVILNLHQRSPLTSPIISEAKKIKIKTATVIFSWDNIPKARLISRYDNYFVWSELMKKELTSLYPEISSSQINIVGTPQFEFYFDDKYSIPKEVFFNKYGLDINKKTICFSGNDTTSPHEADYLNDICKEFSKLEEVKRPQIIFRRSPVDKSNRFDDILYNYSHLIFSIDPDWRICKNKDENFTTIFPTYNDVFLLTNTVKHSDLVINLGSTVALDFSILDKPCLYLNYDPVLKPILKVKDIYNFQHFRSMQNINAVGWINSKKEIAPKILEALKSPETIGKDRKKWLDIIIKYKNTSSIELVKHLTN